ncbi:MAG: hypothetical protein GY696_25255 [Gammaproteobacteria bacterium]|nr:hypothetical protein [Gammaproteobacteria bacterium]
MYFQVLRDVTYEDINLAIQSEFWKEDPEYMIHIACEIKRLVDSGQPFRILNPFSGIAYEEWHKAMTEHVCRIKEGQNSPSAVAEAMLYSDRESHQEGGRVAVCFFTFFS